METGTGAETEIRAVAKMGTGDEDGNGVGHVDGIGEGGRAAKKREKLHKSCRRHLGNGIGLGGNRNKSVDKKGLVQ